jgi:hypothetical protein
MEKIHISYLFENNFHSRELSPKEFNSNVGNPDIKRGVIEGIVIGKQEVRKEGSVPTLQQVGYSAVTFSMTIEEVNKILKEQD